MYQFSELQRAKDVHEQYLSILANVGGVLTFNQTAKILELLDGGRFTTKSNYMPDKYLSAERAARRIKVDYAKEIVILGSGNNLISYNKYSLAAVTCALDIIDNADDLCSISQPIGGYKGLDFTYEGNIYKLIFVSHDDVESAAQAIATSERQVAQIRIKAASLHPNYLIFVTDDTPELIELTLKRLGDLQIEYPHTVVTMNDGIDADRSDLSYYSMSPDDEGDSSEQ